MFSTMMLISNQRSPIALLHYLYFPLSPCPRVPLSLLLSYLLFLLIRINNPSHQFMPNHIADIKRNKFDTFDIFQDFRGLH